MTITSRVSLKAALSDGQTLTGDNLANLIDSYIHLTDTSAQSVASPVTFTASVQAANINCNDIDTSSVNFAHAAGGSIAVSGLRVTTIVSAAKIEVDGSATFDTINCNDIDTSALSFAHIVGGSINVSSLSANFVYASSVNTPTVNCNSVNAGDVSCSSISVSGIGAALVNTGRIVVSAISANKIWSSALNVYSALSIFGSSTAVAVGDGSATPASVAGFIKVNFNGAEVFLPYYTGS